MATHLIVEDGVAPYWWTSLNIWVVPGSDPNGPVGQPAVGHSCYLWARVQNQGDSVASNARVDFYWANPAAQIEIGVVTRVGSAFTDLGIGETKAVLCLVPWIPTWVNGGHECLIAVVHGDNDENPLPDPLPSLFPLNPPAWDQIAQSNLNVLQAAQLRTSVSVMVNAFPRGDKHATLRVERGKALAPKALEQLGLHGLRPATEAPVTARLTRQAQCADGEEGEETLEIRVKRGTRTPVFVTIQAKGLASEEYAVLHVVERDGETVVGGVSYVITNRENSQKEQAS